MQTYSTAPRVEVPRVPKSGSAKRREIEWDDQPDGFCFNPADGEEKKVVPASVSADEFHEAMAWDCYLEMMAEQCRRGARTRVRMSW